MFAGQATKDGEASAVGGRRRRGRRGSDASDQTLHGLGVPAAVPEGRAPASEVPSIQRRIVVDDQRRILSELAAGGVACPSGFRHSSWQYGISTVLSAQFLV